MFTITSFIRPQTLLELVSVLIGVCTDVKMSAGSRSIKVRKTIKQRLKNFDLLNISVSASSISTVKYIFGLLYRIRFGLSKERFLTHGADGRPFDRLLHLCKTSVILIAISISSSTVSIVNFNVAALFVHVLCMAHAGTLLIGSKRTRAWMINTGVLSIQGGSSKTIRVCQRLAHFFLIYLYYKFYFIFL